MKGFAALLRLQLLSRLADLKPRNIRTQLREKRGKTVGMLIAYVFLFIYLGGFLVFLETTLLDQVLIPMGIPDLLLTMAVTLAMVSTLIMSFFFIMSSLYFGRDSAFIASLPVKPRTVLCAKLTQVWISETLIDAIFILPACIIYGVKTGLTDPLFYLRGVIVWLGVSVLPIAIVSFISSLLIRLSSLWKHREMVVTVAGIVLLVAYMALCMGMGNMFGSDDAGDMMRAFFTSNQARIEGLTRIFPPAGWAAKGLIGDWGQLALFVAVCAAAAAFTVWAMGFFYQKLSLLQTETPSAARKGEAKKASFASSSAFRACVKREILQVLRTPAYATNILPIAIVSFISSLLIRLSSLWKHREMVVTVAGIVLLVAYMALCMGMGNMFGSDDAGDMMRAFFTSNQARIEGLTRIFPPAGWAAKGLIGDWGQLALFVAVCAAAAAFTVWAMGFFYQKLSLLQTETPSAAHKGEAKKASFASSSAFRACVKREIRQVLRTPAYATNILPIALMPALMTGMIALSFNRNTEAAEESVSLTSLLGGLNPAIVLAILTGVMAFMAGMNNFLSTAVTREGKGHQFLCALPIRPRVSVMAKMSVGAALTLIGCALAAAVIIVLLPDFIPQAVMAFVLTVVYGYFTGALALASDVRNPKLDWLTETEAIKQKSGALIGMLLSWALLAALGVISYLLLSAGASLYVYFAAMAAILAAGAFFAHRMLMKAADEKYCLNP